MEEAASGLIPLESLSTRRTEHVDRLSGVLYGKLAIWIIVVTGLNNGLIIFNLTNRPKRFTPTCLQYVGISISQTLTVFFQCPVLVYFFNERQQSTDDWCISYHVLGYLLPSICHMSTVWQTVLLGIQRLLCYTWPFRLIPYYRKTVLLGVTMSIYLSSVAFHFTRIFDSSIIATKTNTSDAKQCGRRYILSSYDPITFHWVNMGVNTYLPCFILCLLMPFLINTVYTNYRQRIATTCPRFLSLTRKRTLRELTVVVIVATFLAVEIPCGYAQTQHILYDHSSLEDKESSLSLVIQTRFVLYVSYMLFFYVHFTMNYKFRNRILKRVKNVVQCQLLCSLQYKQKNTQSCELVKMRHRYKKTFS